MAYRSGRVPGSAKMHVLDAEVGSDQQFRARRKTQNSAIVAYSANQPYAQTRGAGCRRASHTANRLDKVSLVNHKIGYNYIKNMYLH